MPFDGSVLYALKSEFTTKLLGYKIEKVQQPEKDEIILQLRGYKDSVKLLLSANAGFPRCHITNEDRENPKTALAFCMLLRKHLTGAKIIEFKQPSFERILEIELDCFDDLGYSSRKSIVLEIMGRHSNLIIMETESRLIIDSIKHVDELTSSVREVLPGVHYVAPPAEGKHDPLNIEKIGFMEVLAGIDGTLEKSLVRGFNGMSPFSAREICFNAGLDSGLAYNSLSGNELSQFCDSFMNYVEKLKKNDFTPQVAYSEGKPFDFFCFKAKAYEEMKVIDYSSISEACEGFYHERDKSDRIRQKAGDLLKLLHNRIDRAQRKIAALNQDLEKANGCEKYRRYGDLIMGAIHEIKTVTPTVKLTDYYSENMETVDVPLDVRYSAIQNAQRYFKKYSKFKKAQITLEEQLTETQEEIKYLEAQVYNIGNCSLEQELNEVRTELAALGFMKSSGKPPKKKPKASSPMRYISSTGFEIFVGKNNIQNEALTMKDSFSTDLWFHVKDFPGSHVVIRCGGKTPDDETLYEAACLAALYSKASNGTKIRVDYTMIKHVKKPKGSKPGMVIYDIFKSIQAEPDDSKLKKA